MDAYNLLSLRLQPSLNCWRVFRDLCILLWVRARPRWFRRLAFCCAVREGIAWRLLSSGTWPVMGIFCLAIIMTTLSIDWCNCWQTLGLLSCCTVRKTSLWQLLTDDHYLYCACSLLCLGLTNGLSERGLTEFRIIHSNNYILCLLKGYIEAIASALFRLGWTCCFYNWFFWNIEYRNIKQNVNTAAIYPLTTCIYLTLGVVIGSITNRECDKPR